MKGKMDQAEVRSKVRKFIAEEVLEGKDQGLDENTPLLEWGVINSFETIRIKKFIQETFGVILAPGDLNAKNLKNISCIADLVASRI